MPKDLGPKEKAMRAMREARAAKRPAPMPPPQQLGKVTKRATKR